MARALIAASLVLGAALPGGLGAQDLQEELTRRPGIRGVVVDRSTRAPIADAQIFLAPDSAQDTNRVLLLTDAEGRFGTPTLPGGLYHLTVERLGYQTMRDTVRFAPRYGLRLEVEMAEQAVELEPLLVVSEARSRILDANGFYDRRRRGIGHFVTRDDDSMAYATLVSDALRRMPGVRIASSPRMGNRGVVLLRGGCRADVWVDGVRAVAPFPVDDILAPGDVEAVEVYRGSEVPPRFGTSPCGVVVIWTHVPNRTSGRGWSWPRFFLAVGLFSVSVLLGR